jgi:prepilin-type N-terminal cleavage/methylation domain-containing protein
MHHKLSTRGFSLMELLAVIAVMALLAALIIPSLTSMMDKGRSMQCAANLRNVAITAFNFSADYDGRIPGLESIHAGPGFATENPNGLSFVQELHIYEYGARNIAYGDSPDTLAKLSMDEFFMATDFNDLFPGVVPEPGTMSLLLGGVVVLRRLRLKKLV